MEEFYRQLENARKEFDKNHLLEAIISYINASVIAIRQQMTDLIIEPLLSALKILKDMNDEEKEAKLQRYIDEIKISIQKDLISREQDKEV
ncbi:MAG: hypothetical protein ACXQS8_05855, partial [Candidatus Helarchaeales archaeon]